MPRHIEGMVSVTNALEDGGYFVPEELVNALDSETNAPEQARLLNVMKPIPRLDLGTFTFFCELCQEPTTVRLVIDRVDAPLSERNLRAYCEVDHNQPTDDLRVVRAALLLLKIPRVAGDVPRL